MSAPWRSQVQVTTANERSVTEFRSSYPEFSNLSAVVRGEMITLHQSPRLRWNFLVNPSDIPTSYQVAGMLRYSDPDFQVTEGALEMLGDGLNSVSFSVMLDRTYEVYQGDSAYRGGVLHDVAALENLLGVPQAQRGALSSLAQSSIFANISGGWFSRGTAEAREGVLTGVIVHKPVRVLFGASDAFSFDGFVTSLSVHYTHFNYRMVPTRAGVSLSMSSIGLMNPYEAGPYRSQDSLAPNAGAGSSGPNFPI